MKKGFLLTLIAFFLCQLTVVAQNYDRYNYFHDEAVKLKNEGKLNEAKEKFKKIRVVCKGHYYILYRQTGISLKTMS